MRQFLKSRAASFGYAFKGLSTLVRTQRNAWIHAAATVVVVICGFVFQFIAWEWVAIIAAITLVWVAEGFNTALEFLADEVTLEHREGIGRAKDVAAAATLLAAIGAAVVGCIVFGSHLLTLIR